MPFVIFVKFALPRVLEYFNVGMPNHIIKEIMGTVIIGGTDTRRYFVSIT